MQLYASVPYSSLVQFQVLDTRQYRSPQVCPRPERGGGNVVLASACPERLDPAQSMLGARQEAWLGAELERSRARWNVIAQQTLMAQADRHRGDDDKAYWTDGWDGYPKARERLLHSIAQARVRNPLVIGGDVHMAAVADLRIDFDDPGSPIVATELCGTSITSQGPSYRTVETLLLKNPHLLYANGARRGYVTLDLTRERSVATLRALRNVRDPDSGIQDLVKYTLEDGRPGAQRS
jgi:alkaline phosphatase D